MAIALAATACPTPKPSLRAQTLYELLLGVLRVVLGFLDQVEEEGVEALGVAVDAKDAVGIYIILLSLKQHLRLLYKVHYPVLLLAIGVRVPHVVVGQILL